MTFMNSPAICNAALNSSRVSSSSASDARTQRKAASATDTLVNVDLLGERPLALFVGELGIVLAEDDDVNEQSNALTIAQLSNQSSR